MINKNTNYLPIIGLEVHVELKTKSKMFCSCKNDPFHAAKPNIYTCPVCLGLPGALPVPNKKAIELTVKLGLGLGCGINQESRFDRKHYFYPDLPKGYQISQYEKPFCEKGKIVIARSEATRQSQSKIDRHAPQDGARDDKTIRIRRVHLEEDTGKLLHRKIDGEDVSLIDFNRSGVPLAEIVTEPDIRSAQEAKETAKKIYQIVRSLGVSDADMEKGSMRLEANVSLYVISSEEQSDESRDQAKRFRSADYGGLDPSTSLGMTTGGDLQLPNYKVEIKNINSFRFLEKAIDAEIERQKKILRSGKKVRQQTFGWDTEKQELKPQRVKEEAADYRYFPEPDIPPIRLIDEWISNLRNQISDLPEEVYEKLVEAGIAEQAAKVISSSKLLSGKMLEIINNQDKNTLRSFGNWLLHHTKEAGKIDGAGLLDLYKTQQISYISDEQEIIRLIDEVISDNLKAVEDFNKGHQEVIGFLIGQIQRKVGGKANANMVRKLLLEKLK